MRDQSCPPEDPKSASRSITLAYAPATQRAAPTMGRCQPGMGTTPSRPAGTEGKPLHLVPTPVRRPPPIARCPCHSEASTTCSPTSGPVSQGSSSETSPMSTAAPRPRDAPATSRDEAARPGGRHRQRRPGELSSQDRWVACRAPGRARGSCVPPGGCRAASPTPGGARARSQAGGSWRPADAPADDRGAGRRARAGLAARGAGGCGRELLSARLVVR